MVRMKKLFWLAPGVGVCSLLMFTSCSSTSTDGDGYSGGYTETALPMSEVAEGELPPWLLEDDGGEQVGAGTQTPALASRNDFAIPEPGGSGATATATAGAGQNQPEIAAAGQDVPVVEAPRVESGVDPLAVGTDRTVVTPAPVETPTVTAPAKVTVKPVRAGGGKKVASTSKKAGSKKGSGKKVAQGKKPKRPTMIVYKVRPGDNLTVIAKRSNTTVEQIRKDSNIQGSKIYPGQTIKVRYTPTGYKPGKESSKGEKKGGNKAKGKGGASKTHTVTSGQTLSGIAAKYGVSTSALMKANGITKDKVTKIRPGQKIKVPAGR